MHFLNPPIMGNYWSIDMSKDKSKGGLSMAAKKARLAMNTARTAANRKIKALRQEKMRMDHAAKEKPNHGLARAMRRAEEKGKRKHGQIEQACTALRAAFEAIKVKASAYTDKGAIIADWIYSGLNSTKQKVGLYRVGWNARLSYKTAIALNAPIYDKVQYPTRFDKMLKAS